MWLLDIVLKTIGGFLSEWAEFLGIVHSFSLYCPLSEVWSIYSAV
jgi:hypothetical protein